jgi:glutathione S-transferase
MTADFIAINPTSTVPALVDDDTKVFDSSAIGIYLVEKYAKDDFLYPKDLKLRTKVNERLFYIASYMYPRAYQIFVPGYFGLETEIPQKKIDDILRAYGTIETFLKGNVYLTGNSLTLADLSLWPSMESLGQVIPVDNEKFPNFTRWMEGMRELPTYEINKKGADEHIGFYRQCVASAKANL